MTFYTGPVAFITLLPFAVIAECATPLVVVVCAASVVVALLRHACCCGGPAWRTRPPPAATVPVPRPSARFHVAHVLLLLL